MDDEELDDDEAGIISGEESEPESESEPEDVRLAEPSKTSIYNSEGLLEKLEDISWPDNVDWIQKLSVVVDQQAGIDVNDDLSRELEFYNQALNGTREAFEKLQSMGLPFLRPPDYYAEMVKTDSHMLKVKGRLLSEKKKIEEAEERRKARDNKKMSKEIQAQKLKEKVKNKKESIESVKKWRKQRQQSGFAKGGEEEMGLNFEDGKGFERNKGRRGVAANDRSGGARGRGGMKGKVGNQKGREFKNSRFGFGGRKGMKKQNTTDTTDSLKGFNGAENQRNKKKIDV
ncbi:hypothetical protein QJS04_geneDACA015258 [Acorus gramineus]|uniref:rRNA-processing protein EBP2 homolog n=1 Tax=Acorus gramineus TaxID=55184 RepID=A0AAV9ARF5_ACOGR|nr:hypothetical protein QJS04_geneDACA015258 [Acorus gramineus]